jgi:hypothetical protein
MSSRALPTTSSNDEESLLRDQEEDESKASSLRRTRLRAQLLFGLLAGLVLFTTLAFCVTRVHLSAPGQGEVVHGPPRGLSAWPGNATSYEDPAYRDAMLRGCGELCNTSILGTPSLFFNETRKRFDCMALYANRDNDAPAPVWPSPVGIPLNLWDDYKMGNRSWIHQWYIEEKYSGGTGMQPVWTVAEIEGMKAQALQDTLPGNYGWGTTSMIWGMMKRYENLLRGKHAFVIGSETPWVEAMLLAIGASHVTTIEYGTIISQHPNVSTMTPAQVTERFLASNGTEPRFDVAVTFSSLEHSGLGRYGDTLNPWGDIQAVAKAWCITKSGGNMFLGLPASQGDEVCWNAHRSYGVHRWPHLMANYKQIGAPEGGMWRENHPEVVAAQWRQPCKFFQPMLVFEKVEAPSS